MYLAKYCNLINLEFCKDKDNSKQSNKCTVKRPKFGNGPLVRHPLFEVLKNNISTWGEVSDQVHWCQIAEFRAAGPKNGPVKFLAA
jgi:hypothetical protein